jgi:hypothetical protein
MVLAVGVYAYTVQLREGLIVTGMRDIGTMGDKLRWHRHRGPHPLARSRAVTSSVEDGRAACPWWLAWGTLLPVAARKPGVAGHREDPLYPRIARAAEDLLQRANVVTPVDVLIGMGLLTREHLEDWRRGRVPYLERVISCNLTRLGRLLRILRFHAHDLNLKPSWTAYMRWGKGPKQRLRFTKTGDPKVEEAYATHFVWPGKGPFHPPTPKETPR